jgi:hypothetical protein
VPADALVIVNHDGSLLLAVHVHQLLVVIAIEPESPPFASVCADGEMLKEQFAADC